MHDKVKDFSWNMQRKGGAVFTGNRKICISAESILHKTRHGLSRQVEINRCSSCTRRAIMLLCLWQLIRHKTSYRTTGIYYADAREYHASPKEIIVEESIVSVPVWCCKKFSGVIFRISHFDLPRNLSASRYFSLIECCMLYAVINYYAQVLPLHFFFSC